MRITRAVVPSLFTVLNMFSGFMSLLHASRGEFIAASWFIILAAGFDALDGIMARITKSSSEFGVEIDSLCRSGVCGTCRTRVVDGDVDCESGVLDDGDREQGWVLACVSQIRSDCTVEV